MIGDRPIYLGAVTENYCILNSSVTAPYAGRIISMGCLLLNNGLQARPGFVMV